MVFDRFFSYTNVCYSWRKSILRRHTVSPPKTGDDSVKCNPSRSQEYLASGRDAGVQLVENTIHYIIIIRMFRRRASMVVPDDVMVPCGNRVVTDLSREEPGNKTSPLRRDPRADFSHFSPRHFHPVHFFIILNSFVFLSLTSVPPRGGRSVCILLFRY